MSELPVSETLEISVRKRTLRERTTDAKGFYPEIIAHNDKGVAGPFVHVKFIDEDGSERHWHGTGDGLIEKLFKD